LLVKKPTAAVAAAENAFSRPAGCGAQKAATHARMVSVDMKMGTRTGKGGCGAVRFQQTSSSTTCTDVRALMASTETIAKAEYC
jgi:hypothetical protein